MHNEIIDHTRRRAIKHIAYSTIVLSFVGILSKVKGAEDLSLAPEGEAPATTEVSRGYVIEIYTPQASSSEATPGAAADTTSQEILLIDGESVPYLKNAQGYHIYYQPPEDSLLNAARSFIETQGEK